VSAKHTEVSTQTLIMNSRPSQPSTEMQHRTPSCSTCNHHSTVHATLVAAWRSGNVTGRSNEPTLHRVQLVLGWVTVFGG